MWILSDKKLLLFWLAIVISTPGFSQQNPQHTLYVMNSYLINPAVGGIESFIDIKAGHRSQWTSIPGSPRTTYISVHAPLKSFKTLPSGANPVKGSINSRFDHTTNQIKNHHSLGGVIQQDKTGNFERYLVNMSYSYHLPLTRKHTLSMGASAGVINQRIDLESVRLADNGDPLLASGNSIIQPDLNLGMWLYADKYYFGVSATRLIPSNQSFFENGISQQVHPTYYFTSGIRFRNRLTKLQYIPSLLVRYNRDAPTAVELSIKTIYNQRLWAGAVFKSNETMALFLGMAVNSNIDFSYSFDYGFTDTVDNLSFGTHELVLGIRLNNKLKILCPENLW